MTTSSSPWAPRGPAWTFSQTGFQNPALYLPLRPMAAFATVNSAAWARAADGLPAASRQVAVMAARAERGRSIERSGNGPSVARNGGVTCRPASGFGGAETRAFQGIGPPLARVWGG